MLDSFTDNDSCYKRHFALHIKGTFNKWEVRVCVCVIKHTSVFYLGSRGFDECERFPL